MVTDDPGAGPLWRLTSPACRVICLAGTDEIKSVAVWLPDRHRYWAVRPDGAELDVLRGFAKQVAGEIVASAWPAGTGAGDLSLEIEAAVLEEQPHESSPVMTIKIVLPSSRASTQPARHEVRWARLLSWTGRRSRPGG